MKTLSRKDLVALVVLTAALALVCLPRFNRQDIGIDNFTSGGQRSSEALADAAEYVKIIECFRGQQDPNELEAPFVFRPLALLVASILPFEPLTALNVLNLLMLIGTLWILYHMLITMGFDHRLCIFGSALFVFSFPAFYYGTIGAVDPAGILFIMLGASLLVRQKWWLAMTAMALGIMAKETTVILLPVLWVHLLLSPGSAKKKAIIALAALGVGLAAYYVPRHMFAQYEYSWTPSMKRILGNVTRPRCWLSFALTFGIPGVLSLPVFYMALRDRTWGLFREYGALMAGAVLSVALFGFAMLTAYADGRFVWTGYPFFIPLAMVMLRRKAGQRDHGTTGPRDNRTTGPLTRGENDEGL